MAEHYGLQTAAGHLTVSEESKDPYAADVLAQLRADADLVIARYPVKRSALLPLLHLVQSVDGYVTGRGIDFCAEVLELSRAEVSGVATFYTQYKRHPNGEYTVGVCTNTLCAIMGGDEIWESVSQHLGIGHDETTEDGKITLERVECNAACDYAPVVMANWEFFDNQTPESTNQLVDDLRAGKDVRPSRGPNKVCTFKQVSRTLAGFPDGLADEGVGAGPASLVGLEVAQEHDWTAPTKGEVGSGDTGPRDESAPSAPAAGAPAKTADSAATSGSGAATAEDDAKGAAEPQTGDAHSSADAPAGTGAGTPQPADDSGKADTAAKSDSTSDAAADTGDKTTDANPSNSSKPAGEGTSEDAETSDGTSKKKPPAAPSTVQAETEPATLFDDGSSTAEAAPQGEDPLTGAPVKAGAPSPATVQPTGTEGFTTSRFGEGTVDAGPDGTGPQGWDIKGNAGSMLFHTPKSPWYGRTKAEVWFRDEEAAKAAGFTDARERRSNKKDES